MQVLFKIYTGWDKPKSAFTLAEVLVTLAIIGIVASLTIPTLFKNNDAKYHTAFKKKYSDMAQAMNMIKADNDGTLKNICPTCTGGEDRTNAFAALFRTKVKYTRECAYNYYTNIDGNCWSSGGTDYLGPSAGPSGSSPLPAYHSAYVLADGTYFRFHYTDNECDYTGGGSFQYCGTLEIDVNGNKGPNTYGKDVYGLYITENGILPYGYNTNYYPRNCVTSGVDYDWTGNFGLSCARKVLEGKIGEAYNY